jgi:phage host-nuclease inhibitor protein Gam
MPETPNKRRYLMKRQKPKAEIIALNTCNDVDKALLEIAQMELELAKIDAHAEQRINEIKDEAKYSSESILKQIKTLADSIFVFSEYKKNELFGEGKKTIELVFGFIGYRQSTKISVSNKDTLKLIKEFGFDNALRIKEEVNKDELAGWKDEELTLVKAKRITEDHFWYETKKEDITQIQETAIKKRA